MRHTLFFCTVITILLQGCDKTPPEPEAEVARATEVSATQDPLEPLTTVLDKYKAESPMNTQIELSTSAESDGNNVHWDDHQRWRLTAQINGENYTLFDNDLGISSIQYWPYMQDDDFIIAMLISGSAQFELVEFHYLEDEQKLEKREIHHPDGNLNVLHQGDNNPQ